MNVMVIRAAFALSAMIEPPLEVRRIMPVEHFATERLSAQNWRPFIEDRAKRHKLETEMTSLLTRRVQKHLPPALKLDSGADAISCWISARAEESDVLLVTLRESGELVGLMILASDQRTGDIPSVHIGYLLAETAWGQGFATELVAGLASAMKHSSPVRLIGGVDPDNPASARVLQKAGFAVDPELSEAGADMYVRNLP